VALAGEIGGLAEPFEVGAGVPALIARRACFALIDGIAEPSQRLCVEAKELGRDGHGEERLVGIGNTFAP